MPRVTRRSAGLLPCARPRSSRGGLRRRRQSSTGDRPISCTPFVSPESFPPSPKNSPLPSTLPTAEPNPHTLDPIHNTLHVSRPPVYSPTRTYVPVRVSDFVAVAADRFAAVSDALGPIDCTRRPPSYQLYPPSSSSHPPPSHFRHSLPTHVDVGVQVNERQHPFSSASPAHPTDDCENNAVTNEGIVHHSAVSPDPQSRLCTHHCCHCPSTFRASVPSFANVTAADIDTATVPTNIPSADHTTRDVFLIDGQDYVSRLVDIVTSHTSPQSAPPKSRLRIHSTPLPSSIPSPTTPDARSADIQSGPHADENTVTASINDTDTDVALVSDALKVARPFDATANNPSLGVSRASTIMSTLSLGAASGVEVAPAVSADSSHTDLEEDNRRADEHVLDEEEPLTPQVHLSISPQLNFRDVLAISSISPCRSPSPVSNLREHHSGSLHSPRLLDRSHVHQDTADVVGVSNAAHALLHAAQDEHDENLSEVHPFSLSGSAVEDASRDISTHPISPLDSVAPLERVSERVSDLFREDEYENDDHDDLHHDDLHHDNDDDDDLLLEIPSNPSVFVAVTSARTLSDLMSVQDDECSSSRLDCDGEDKDEITPIAHRVIPSLWLRPQSAPCSHPVPPPLLTSPCHALPHTQDSEATPNTSHQNPPEDLKVSIVSKSETVPESEKEARSEGISPRRGNGIGKGGTGGGSGGSGSLSLSPSRLFRKSWTKRKSSESGLTSSSTEYYEDDYLKFMEGACLSSKPPLRLLPHPAFARLIGADGRALRSSRFDCSESSISVSTSDEEYRPFCGNSS